MLESARHHVRDNRDRGVDPAVDLYGNEEGCNSVDIEAESDLEFEHIPEAVNTDVGMVCMVDFEIFLWTIRGWRLKSPGGGSYVFR